jgi:hypothetical protein
MRATSRTPISRNSDTSPSWQHTGRGSGRPCMAWVWLISGWRRDAQVGGGASCRGDLHVVGMRVGAESERASLLQTCGTGTNSGGSWMSYTNNTSGL